MGRHLLLALALYGLAPHRSAGEGESIQLANGVRATIVQVLAMDRQTTFVVFPLATVADGAGELRRSRLLERMMRRSTDPEGNGTDGMRFGGLVNQHFAMQWSMVPELRWEEGLERHASWLEAEEWEMGVLERELEGLQQELDGLAAEPWSTHGTAVDVWSHVLRFGIEHLSVGAGVEGLGELDVARVIRARVPVGEGLEVYCVGPRSEAELLPVLGATLGALEAREVAPPEEPPALRAKWPERVSWDLPWRHLVYWYPVEAEDPWHRLGAGLLVDRLNFRFGTHEEDELAGGRAAALLVEPVPGRAMLVVSIALAEDARERDARKLLDLEIKDLPKSRGLAFRDQLSWLQPDPRFPMDLGGSLRGMYERMPRARLDEMERERGATEYNILRGQLDNEYRYGADAQAVAQTAASIDVNDLERYPKKLLAKRARRELLLEPAGDD